VLQSVDVDLLCFTLEEFEGRREIGVVREELKCRV